MSLLVNFAGGHLLSAGIPALHVEGIEPSVQFSSVQSLSHIRLFATP